MRGKNILVPANADVRLSEIILKACRFNPKDIYEIPLHMREELENILYNGSEAKIIYPNGNEVDYEVSTTGKSDNEQTVSIFGEQAVKEETVGLFENSNIKKIDKKRVHVMML